MKKVKKCNLVELRYSIGIFEDYEDFESSSHVRDAIAEIEYLRKATKLTKTDRKALADLSSLLWKTVEVLCSLEDHKDLIQELEEVSYALNS